MKKIILTGDRPTGRLHVGHYVGSLKERVSLQNSGEYDEVYIMVADAQALTDNADNPEKVRQNVMQVALDYLSCGIDPTKSNIFIQSKNSRTNILPFFGHLNSHIWAIFTPCVSVFLSARRTDKYFSNRFFS